MTPAMQRYEQRYERSGLELRIARARMLLDLAGKVDADRMADLLTFARDIGDESVADSMAAFRSAQTEQLQAAQAELDRLTGPLDTIRDSRIIPA